MSRRIVVSGAASGIGRALAERLRQDGDTVLTVDLRDADVCADLGVEGDRQRAVSEVVHLSNSAIDAIVACAGVAGSDPKLLSVNHFGATALLTGLRPALASSSAPRAAVISSVVATHSVLFDVVEACLDSDEEKALQLGYRAVATGRKHELYPASKQALAQWVRRTAVRREWAGAGIALNAVAPGVVVTPMTDGLRSDPGMRAVLDRRVPMPLNGHAPPEAVASALAWLVSVENTHITGQTLFVDGGAEALTNPCR